MSGACHTITPLNTLSPLEPSGGASGQASDIAIHAKEILRIRELLTGIYQHHCAKEGESVAAGVERFGSYSCLCIKLNAELFWLERALERDYFLTGEIFHL